MPMAALGLFVFTLKTAPYQQLQRHTAWRHPASSRVGQRPARQFIGPGDDSITLTGTLHPELTGGQVSLIALRAMADTGMAWPLIQGDGLVYGLYVIEDMNETKSVLMPNGSARQIDFTLKLSRVDEMDAVLGDLLSTLPLLLP